MLMKHPNKKSRISSSTMTAVCWSLILVAAKPRSSVVQVHAPDTRNLTDKLVPCLSESWSVVSCFVKKEIRHAKISKSGVKSVFSLLIHGVQHEQDKRVKSISCKERILKYFILDTFSRDSTRKDEIIIEIIYKGFVN